MPSSSHPRSTGPAVLVTDAGRGSAVTIIRSLGRKGFRVIAADSTRSSLGFRSRYADDRLVYPPPESQPQAFVAALLRAAKDRGVELIIPVTDAAILPLSEARDSFAGVCRLAIPERNALAVVTNKLQTLRLAEQLGVPVPKTCMVETVAEARTAAPEIGWPLVLKPLASRKYRDGSAIESYTVTYAENEEDLARQMQKFEGRCPVLLQEYYPGEGCGVELLLAEGRPLAAFQHHRLREIPISGGASAFRESVPVDPLLYQYAVKLLGALCWTGLAMVEFKVGRDGPKLMEINGRVWGSLPLAVLSGMDFPAKLAGLYFSSAAAAEAPCDMGYQVGVRSRNLGLEILWILTVLKGKEQYPFLSTPSRKQAVKAAVDLFNPRYRFDVLSRDDPRPGYLEVWKVLQKISSKVREAA